MIRLGFAEGPDLICRWTAYKAKTSRHIVRQALETIKVTAVFGFPSDRADEPSSFTPVLYFAVASSDEQANYLHKLVWSQGVVPILVIATPHALQIRKSLGPPSAKPISVPWSKLEGGAELPVELTSLTSVALRSSVVWNDFAINRSGRVDKTILEAIKSLNDEVQAKVVSLKSEPALINAVIGRFIYLFVLIDRGIISPEWIGRLKNGSGKALCPIITDNLKQPSAALSDVQWPAREVWALFDAIDDVLNGTIFPVKAVDRRRIPTDALHLVRRAIRHGDKLGGGSRQLGFFDVSFATLRTETISAIYELFLFIEDSENKTEDGAFYTPPFLVDYVLDQVDRIKPFTRSSRVLDPAAGSGIFLVGAFRRILERTMPRGRWQESHFRRARALLQSAVFGIERNTQAANVARFSLYMTLLDYVENTKIEKLKKFVKRERVFPELTKNVLARDVFSVQGQDIGQFTHDSVTYSIPTVATKHGVFDIAIKKSFHTTITVCDEL